MELSLPASWRYTSSGTPQSLLECHSSMSAQINRLQITPRPFSFGSAESNGATTSNGSAGNLCVRLLCFCTQILKRGFPGASPDGNVV